jgi:hypothetical protein
VPQTANSKRLLTGGEEFVLAQVQDIYGSHNCAEDVFFDGTDGAVIFAKNAAGVAVMAVALTNLASWYADGTIKSIDDLRKNWLRHNV